MAERDLLTDVLTTMVLPVKPNKYIRHLIDDANGMIVLSVLTVKPLPDEELIRRRQFVVDAINEYGRIGGE